MLTDFDETEVLLCDVVDLTCFRTGVSGVDGLVKQTLNKSLIGEVKLIPCAPFFPFAAEHLERL